MRKNQVFDGQGNIIHEEIVPYSKKELTDFIEDYRWQVGDNSPITIGDFTVTGDPTTRAAIAETIKFWEELPEQDQPATITWQGLPDSEGGYYFHDVTLAELKAMGLAIGQRRVKSFAVKKNVLDAIASESVDTIDDAKDLFDAGMAF